MAGKDFTISEVKSSRVLCECRRQAWHEAASAGAGMDQKESGLDKYYLRIQPGVDAAFVTLLAVMLDEIYNDEKKE